MTAEPRGTGTDGGGAAAAPADGASPPSPAGGALRVRRATESDLTTIVALRMALLQAHRANILYARLRRDAPARARKLFAAQLSAPDEVTFLAIEGEEGGTVLGILRCVHARGYPLLDPTSYGYVSSVYVVPEARRRGVLRVMLAEAEGWCRERGLTELRLHSVVGHGESNAAWDALGFEPVEVLRVRPIGR